MAVRRATGDNAQDCGLAAAGRTEEAAIGLVRDCYIDAVYCVDETVKALNDPCKLDAARSNGHADAPQVAGTRTARRFWIEAMAPRQITILTHETVGVQAATA